MMIFTKRGTMYIRICSLLYDTFDEINKEYGYILKSYHLFEYEKKAMLYFEVLKDIYKLHTELYEHAQKSQKFFCNISIEIEDGKPFLLIHDDLNETKNILKCKEK